MKIDYLRKLRGQVENKGSMLAICMTSTCLIPDAPLHFRTLLIGLKRGTAEARGILIDPSGQAQA